jgi:hypothetical protein
VRTSAERTSSVSPRWIHGGGLHGFAGVDGGRSSSARYPSFAPPTRTQVARIRCQTSKPTADGGNAPPALGPAAPPHLQIHLTTRTMVVRPNARGDAESMLWLLTLCATAAHATPEVQLVEAGGAAGHEVKASMVRSAAPVAPTPAAATAAPPGYSAAQPARNVLYLVFDDLRPDLSFYGAAWMRTPHLQRLAESGTTFEAAYCQETVCSPSRMSFTTGRRPNSTRAWNFLNHIRQAECDAMPGVQLSGTPLIGTRHRGGVSFRDLPPGDSGGSAQCCTDCHASRGCAGWHMRNHTCLLFSALDAASRAPCTNDGATVCLSGVRVTPHSHPSPSPSPSPNTNTNANAN